MENRTVVGGVATVPEAVFAGAVKVTGAMPGVSLPAPYSTGTVRYRAPFSE